MDFFRRVFNKSTSDSELKPPPASSGGDSLFGGLELNDTEPVSDDRGSVVAADTSSAAGSRFVPFIDFLFPLLLLHRLLLTSYW